MRIDTRPISTSRHVAAGPPRAKAHGPASPPAADFVLRSEPGSERWPAQQLDALRRWTAAWLDREPNGMFVMGCTAPGHRSARVEQLRALRSELSRLGIAEERIRYTGDAIAPMADAAAATDGARAATARLKLVRARDAERQVCSIRSMFAADCGGKEESCTGAF
jgi:hypothetical protein